MSSADAPLGSRRALGLALLLGGLAAAIALSLMVGSSMMPLSRAWEGLWAHDGSEASLIVWTLRVPRTVMAIVVGAAFAVAGALIQAITRNPLADPGILGVDAGAGFAVTIGLALLGIKGGTGQLWLAFGGALAATLLVYAIGRSRSGTSSPITLVLAGVALGAFLGGIEGALELLDPDTFRALRDWGLGSVAVTSLDTLRLVAPYFVVAFVISATLGGSLNAVALGDEAATALGAHVLRTRLLGIVAVTLLAGGGTALTGGLDFVGLMVPHVVRWFTGPDQRWILAYSTLGGAVLALSADVLGRVLVIPSELEAGLVTSIIGAPMLIVLVRRRTASAL